MSEFTPTQHIVEYTNNIIMKIIHPLRDKSYKILFKTKKPIKDVEPYGDIYECYQYESASSAHWRYCKDIQKDMYVYGLVRLLYPVFSFAPMTYGEFEKPVPPEGKRIVRDFKFFRYGIVDMIKDLLEKSLPDIKNMLLIHDYNGISIYLYRSYDMKMFLGREVARQENLVIYEIPTDKRLEKILENLAWKTSDILKISNHMILFKFRGNEDESNVYENVSYVKSSLHTKNVRIESAIIKTFTNNEMIILHPEHGKTDGIILEANKYYYIEHISFPRDIE